MTTRNRSRQTVEPVSLAKSRRESLPSVAVAADDTADARLDAARRRIATRKINDAIRAGQSEDAERIARAEACRVAADIARVTVKPGQHNTCQCEHRLDGMMHYWVHVRTSAPHCETCMKAYPDESAVAQFLIRGGSCNTWDKRTP